MWLPKDERKILAFYYRKNPIGSGLYSSQDWSDIDLLLRLSNGKKLVKNPQLTVQTIEQITLALCNRGLIHPLEIFSLTAQINVRLTPQGMLLGQKYNSWWSSSGLWFAEYKDHWFWFILSFLGGIIGALLVNWLSSLFTKSSGC